MQRVLSLILGGGRGTRLYPLTMLRSKPAVPVAGKYRLIDIPISNCLNSGMNRIYVLTQFLSVSLHRHIANSYKFDAFSRGFVEVLAAQQTNEAADWYQGTADAVRQNIRYVEQDGCREVLVLSGDQLYRMDFRQVLKTHREHKADVTIAVLPVTREQAAGFGMVRLDDQGRVAGFVEKPQTDEQLAPVRIPAEWLARHGISGGDRQYLASMGIYLFNRRVLFDLLKAEPLAADFGKEVFPRSIKTHRVQAHLFDGYWEDLGTVKSYHEANLALAGDDPPFDFHSPEGVIYTRMRFLPASRVSGATLEQCLVSDGCVVQSGTRMTRCVVGVRSRIGRDVVLNDTVIIGADRFETDAERAANRARDIPDFTVGDGSVIERAVLDKDCRVGRNVHITNRSNVQEDEGQNYVIRDGIVVIPRAIVVPDGTVI
ncbi:MAG TPA: glucose-1-phosphate adenylyltransferase [Gemmataceae bacterium]|jgi:glucose-1-phosphate adenylyltransferase|nr:glucose-1-phosphate adenylyltransferase [Gemmataceae bacterium]